jgi:hypothetical protein
MSEPPDLESLVRRYLDLWQEQWAALAADPELADALARWFGMLNQAGGVLAGAAPARPARSGRAAADGGGAEERNVAGREASGGSQGRASPRAATAGAPSRDGGLDLAQLAERLAALDERLAALEAGARRRSGGAARKPRRRRA